MSGDEQLQIDFRWTARALGVLRIVTALLFLEHGTGKLLGFPMTSMAFPPPWTMFWVAGLLETIGSLLLLVGLFTRPVAFVLAGEMAIAYWMIHAQESLFPMINKGEGAILFCFIFLLFVATGPGKWSVDEILRRRKPEYEGYAAPGGERQYSEDEFGGGPA
ncbi:MAG: DoxX family protein [Sphingomicrobium sp.]